MMIAVIDGMGGGIGAQIVSALREELPSYIEVCALGTNSIVMPNSMMGEVTSAMSEAVCDSEAFKILLPIIPENFDIVGLEKKPLSLLIKDTIKLIKKEFNIK